MAVRSKDPGKYVTNNGAGLRSLGGRRDKLQEIEEGMKGGGVAVAGPRALGTEAYAGEQKHYPDRTMKLTRRDVYRSTVKEEEQSSADEQSWTLKRKRVSATRSEPGRPLKDDARAKGIAGILEPKESDKRRVRWADLVDDEDASDVGGSQLKTEEKGRKEDLAAWATTVAGNRPPSPELPGPKGSAEPYREIKIEHSKHGADKARVEASRLLSKGRVEEAEKWFTKGLWLVESEEVKGIPKALHSALLSDRALSRIQLHKWPEAEADCSKAMAVHSKTVKARYRRAVARDKLGKLEDALEDVEMVLWEHWENEVGQICGEAKKLKQRIAQRLQNAKELVQEAQVGTAGGGGGTSVDAQRAHTSTADGGGESRRQGLAGASAGAQKAQAGTAGGGGGASADAQRAHTSTADGGGESRRQGLAGASAGAQKADRNTGGCGK